MNRINIPTGRMADDAALAAKRAELKRKLLEGGKITLKKDAREVIVNNEIVSLTNKEYDILLYFLENKGVALSRKDILTRVWGDDYFGDGRTVDTHVKMLRSHLGTAGDYVKTVHGIGYKFER